MYSGQDGSIRIPDNDLDQWVSEVSDFASVLGLQMAHKMAPCSLHPIPMPRKEFEKGIVLAPIFNLLCDRIEHHPTFLSSALNSVLKADPFTESLFKIYEEARHLPSQQKMSLYIDRSDYMIHNGHIKQVEINTISSGFAALSSRVSKLHRVILPPTVPVENIPINLADVNVARTIAAAIGTFADDGLFVLMVVQPNEANMVDQRSIEFILFDTYRVRTIRRTLSQISDEGTVSNGVLTMSDNGGRYPIGVAYFRAGYKPSDYPSDKDWSARLLIEKSSAIKCPTVAHQLSGTKKVQQALSIPANLASLLPDRPEDCLLLQSVFARQWAFDDDTSREIIGKAVEHPHGFVLKPQREGGGNNFYDEELQQKLRTSSMAELQQYVLMEKLQSPLHPTISLRNGKASAHGESISEFGFFSVWLGDGVSAPLVNEYAGLLVRTKPVGANEGGVMAGFSVLDSVILV